MVVSYSMFEPESEPVCECRYDEVHDRMDREDCSFHRDMEEAAPPAEPLAEKQTAPKIQATISKRYEENAA